MRILILDGNENQAVACVRSLARAGHMVRVGATSCWSKAGWSRDCRGTFTYPDPRQDLPAFLGRIEEEVRGKTGTLVLPMTERTTLPLSAGRDRIMAAGGRLVLPPHETVLQAFDKEKTTSLARSLGLVVPQTVLVENEVRAADLAPQLRYPQVLKPRTSEEIYGTQSKVGHKPDAQAKDCPSLARQACGSVLPALSIASGKIRTTGPPVYARNPDEFRAAYAVLRQRCRSVLAQEFVEGNGVGYFALMREGELRLEFAHRRIRDVRPTGSGSAVRQSVFPEPAVREAALAVLRALRWHGVAMVEFRLRPDGCPVFLEVNGRFWNSLPLAVYAGADFPRLLAQLAEHGDVQAPTHYRVGVRCRWLLGDFRHLVEVWRGKRPEYPGRFPGRLRTLGSFLMPVPGTFHDNFALRDPLPELGDWLDFAVRRLPSLFRNKRP